MLVTDYDPRTKVPLFSEQDIENYLVLCHTKYEDHGTLSIIRRNSERVYMVGVSVNFNYHLQNKRSSLEYWDMPYNRQSKRLINLISNKWQTQHYIHVVYVIKTKNDLNTIIKMFDLSDSQFLKELEQHPNFKSVYGD